MIFQDQGHFSILLLTHSSGLLARSALQYSRNQRCRLCARTYSQSFHPILHRQRPHLRLRVLQRWWFCRNTSLRCKRIKTLRSVRSQLGRFLSRCFVHKLQSSRCKYHLQPRPPAPALPRDSRQFRWTNIIHRRSAQQPVHAGY